MAKGITILEGDDLKVFLANLAEFDGDTYRVRIWADPAGSIKIKVNERMWTYSLGKADI
jgi:hypothetical protein